MKPRFKLELRPSTFLKFVVFPASICILAGLVIYEFFMEGRTKKK